MACLDIQNVVRAAVYGCMTIWKAARSRYLASSDLCYQMTKETVSKGGELRGESPLKLTPRSVLFCFLLP